MCCSLPFHGTERSVNGTKNSIMIDCLPRNLKAFCQFFGLNFSSLAKELDDGFSAPACIHILSPPHSLLQSYRTKIMSNIPLHFLEKIRKNKKT